MSATNTTNWEHGFLATDILAAAKASLELATTELLDIENVIVSIRAAIGLIEQAQHHVGELEFECGE